MEKKTWEWQGEEMHEAGCVDAFRLASRQRVGTRWPVLVLSAVTREELYANAVKAGCIEVVKPVACPMCGNTTTRIDGRNGNEFWVECFGHDACRMTGPSKPTKREAADVWENMAAMIARCRKPRTADN